MALSFHAGNGYLPDQFLQGGVNRRTDMYGGSLENRSRFLLQVVEALVLVWGGNRWPARIAPGRQTWNGMSRIAIQKDVVRLCLAKELNRLQVGLSAHHRAAGQGERSMIAEGQSLRLRRHGYRKIFKGKNHRSRGL